MSDQDFEAYAKLMKSDNDADRLKGVKGLRRMLAKSVCFVCC